MDNLDECTNNRSNNSRAEIDRIEKALIDVIKDGSLIKTKQIVQNAIKTYKGYFFRDEVLINAIFWKRENIAIFLVKSGANVNAVDRFGDSALMKALLRGLKKLSFYMILKGANLYHINDDGQTPFFYAIKCRMSSLAKIILNKKEKLNKDNSIECAIIPIVAGFKEYDFIDPLLKMGADVNRSDKLGISALMVSINVWIREIWTKIDDHRLKLETLDSSPYYLEKELRSVKSNAQDIRVVEKLLNSGADINSKEKFGNTPLMIAAISGFLGAVELLISNHADINAVDKYGNSVLKKAVYREHIEIAQSLLKAGADPNMQNSNNESAIHDAVYRKNIGLIKILIDYDADINLKNETGHTPLHFAIKQNWLEGVKFLIRNGAELTAIDHKNRAAIDYAAANGFEEIDSYLRSIGVEPVENDYEHIYIRTNPIEFLGNDIAYAFIVIPGANQNMTYIVFAAGFCNRNQIKPEIRKFIISFNGKKISEFFSGKERLWFDHWELGKGFHSEKLGCSVVNRDKVIMPKRMPKKYFTISPPNDFSSIYKKLSNSLFSYINIERTTQASKSNKRTIGKFKLTAKANERIADEPRILSSHTSIEHIKRISEITELYFMEGYYYFKEGYYN